MVNESYREGTPLAWLCGDSDRIRLLSVFVGERGAEISRWELSKQTDLTRKKVDGHLDDFVRIGLVEQTARSGHSRWYRLNEDCSIAEHLSQLDTLTLRALLERDGRSRPDFPNSLTRTSTKNSDSRRRNRSK